MDFLFVNTELTIEFWSFWRDSKKRVFYIEFFARGPSTAKVSCNFMKNSISFHMKKRGNDPQRTITKKHLQLGKLLRLEKKDLMSVNFTFSILGQNFAFWRKSVFFYAFLETRDFLGFLIFVISMQKVKFTWDISREKMMNLFQHFVVISLC